MNNKRTIGIFAAIAAIASLVADEVQIQTYPWGLTHSCGWMAADSTLSTAFQEYKRNGMAFTNGVPDGTTVYTWDEGTQQWRVSTFQFGQWDSDLDLKTARGFLLQSPDTADTIIYKLQFTPYAQASLPVTLLKDKWYFLSRPWPDTWNSDNRGFLEVSDYDQYNWSYPNFNWNQKLGTVDTLHRWVVTSSGWGEWTHSIGTEAWPNQWSGSSVVWLLGWSGSSPYYSYDARGTVYSSFMFQNTRGEVISWNIQMTPATPP